SPPAPNVRDMPAPVSRYGRRFRLPGGDETPVNRLRDTCAVSANVDAGDFDGVVAVAEAVPRWDVGLHIAVRVGRTGAKGVPSRSGPRPVEWPALPVIGAFLRLEVCRVPVTFAGEADVDVRHGSGARPRLSANGVGAGRDGGVRGGVGDAGANAHGGDGFVWPV